jgi:dihydropteroate synthase
LSHRNIVFPRRSLVMGIVNVNDDSFSGDGTLDVGEALEKARAQAEAGADVIDVGAESARTDCEAVAVAEELRRLRGFLEGWTEVVAGAMPRDEEQVWPPVVAVNTWRPEVVEQVLGAGLGVELVNDMGGLPDDRNARLCAEARASLLIMHSVGEPKVAHREQQWDDVMGAMEKFFEEKIALAEAVGMEKETIVIDPGIDFAKQKEDNLTVLRELGRLQRFGRPVLVPVSRKTVIGEVLGIGEPAQRDAGTVGLIAASLRRGAQIVRVHDVAAAWAVVKVVRGIDL